MKGNDIMIGTEMIIVAFNEADACDSKAFHTWDGFFSWVRDQVNGSEEWYSKAVEVYNTVEDTEVVPFDTWLSCIGFSDSRDICEYFGYSTIEEIDVEG